MAQTPGPFLPNQTLTAAALDAEFGLKQDADLQGTVNVTATGIINPVGLRSVLVNVGTVSTMLTVSPGYQGQTLRLEIKQGTTPQAVAFDASVMFSADIPSFTATATANARDLVQLICINGVLWAIAGINKGFPS